MEAAALQEVADTAVPVVTAEENNEDAPEAATEGEESAE